jgi:hypothetical protein
VGYKERARGQVMSTGRLAESAEATQRRAAIGSAKYMPIALLPSSSPDAAGSRVAPKPGTNVPRNLWGLVVAVLSLVTES